MPVIVIGADSPLGEAITDTLSGRGGERRAFVSSPGTADQLREAGFKVAIGDISDWTHIEGACMGAYTAVLVADAATDGRELAFAATPDKAVDSWLRAVRDAEVSRVILVGPERRPPGGSEWAVVDPTGRSPDDVAAEVARLDEAARI